MKMIIVSESDNQMHLNDKIDCFASFGICDDIDTFTVLVVQMMECTSSAQN